MKCPADKSLLRRDFMAARCRARTFTPGKAALCAPCGNLALFFCTPEHCPVLLGRYDDERTDCNGDNQETPG